MKHLLIVLLALSFQAYAGIEVVNHSTLNSEARVFPFEASGIKFNAKNNAVPYPQQYNPSGVNLERIIKVHRDLLKSISSTGKIAKTLNLLDSQVVEVDYQITTDHEPRVFINNIYENGSVVEGKISIRILIPGEYDYRGIRLSETRFFGLSSAVVNDIDKSLKNTDKYRAVTMLQESNQILNNSGRAPAFVEEIEVADGPRIEINNLPVTELDTNVANASSR